MAAPQKQDPRCIATPGVSSLWVSIGQVGRKIATVGAILIAASAFVQTADAQQSWRPLPNDPEQFRMIEDCLELTFGRSGGKETTRMYEACPDRQLAAQS